MRKLIPLCLAAAFLLLPVLAGAQQATLTAPVVRNSEQNLRAETLYITRDGGGRWEIEVSVRDSGGTEIRRLSFSGPDAAHPAATAIACATAYTTIRATETGTLARKLDFRLLGFLSDQGYIAEKFGAITLVP